MKSVQVNANIPVRVFDILNEYRRLFGESTSSVVRKAINEYVVRHKLLDVVRAAQEDERNGTNN